MTKRLIWELQTGEQVSEWIIKSTYLRGTVCVCVIVIAPIPELTESSMA